MNDSNYTVPEGNITGPAGQTAWWHWTQVSLITCISLVIILGNIINLIILRHVRQMAWATRTFLINLSVSDLLVGLIACAPSIYPAVVDRWVYGAVWCQFSGITHGTSVTISIWSISMVGVERYIASTKPFKYQAWITPSKCFLIITCMWAAAILTFVAPNFTRANFVYYKYNMEQKICGLHWDYPAYCIITGIYIPVLSGGVLIYTSVHINKALKGKDANRRVLRTKDTKITISKKTFRILIATSLAYFSCWGPYVIMVIVMAIAPWIHPPQWFQFSTMWAANTNSAMNIFIYSNTNRHFRQAAKNLLCHLLCNTSNKRPVNKFHVTDSVSLQGAAELHSLTIFSHNDLNKGFLDDVVGGPAAGIVNAPKVLQNGASQTLTVEALRK